MAVNTRQIIEEIANLKRQLANMVIPVTLSGDDGVLDNKLRANMGNDKNGSPVKSPYLHPITMGGDEKVRHGYAKNQRMTMLSPNGDPRSAVLLPGRTDEHGKPHHANKSGKNEVTTQIDEPDDDQQQQQSGSWDQRSSGSQSQQSGQQKVSLRSSSGYDGHDRWVQQNEGEKGTGGLQSQAGSYAQPDKNDKTRKTNGDKATVKYRLNNGTGFTARNGGESGTLISAVKEGAKLRAGAETYKTVSLDGDMFDNAKRDWYAKITEKVYFKIKNGDPYINKPWIIKDEEKGDPVPNDFA